MKEITNVIADVRKKLSTFISSGEKKKAKNHIKDDTWGQWGWCSVTWTL